MMKMSLKPSIELTLGYCVSMYTCNKSKSNNANQRDGTQYYNFPLRGMNEFIHA
jgi:hypothetical protein